MPKKAPPPSPSTPDPSGAILQFKIWLLGLSPMVWRRVQVPATFTLRQFHGVIQVAMGWEGAHLFRFHLRAVRYGSSELSARSVETTLEDLRLRRRARFLYEYDLNVPWRHEVRLEERLERTHSAKTAGNRLWSAAVSGKIAIGREKAGCG